MYSGSAEQLLARRDGKLFPTGGAIPPEPVPLERRLAIHISDLSQFTSCRRKWDWSSPLRRHLQPAILPKPLIFGQCIHIAMEAGYQDCIGKEQMDFDFLAAVTTFRDALDRRKEMVEHRQGPLWDDEKSMFSDMDHLGVIMLKHYSLWAPYYDKDYQLMSSEELFRVALPGERNICYEGRFDGIVRDKTGRYFVLEFKTTRSLSGMSGVYRSMQSSMYTWAAQQLYDPRVQGLTYRVLRKREPDMPKVLQNGDFSRAKSQKTTIEWVKYCLDRMSEKGHDRRALRRAADGLITMLGGRENEFFTYKVITRNSTTMQNALKAIKHVGNEMANPHVEIFPVTGYHCSFCGFRDPCDLCEEGMPEAADAVLDVEYAPRDYWETMADEDEDSG